MTDRRSLQARLEDLREGLLAVHKALLTIARDEYEGEHGPIESPGALLQLLIKDEAFAWLHPVSELAASADELAEEKEIREPDAVAIAKTAEGLLTPGEHGEGFAKKYWDAMQRSPDVVLAHAHARRAIVALGTKTASAS